MYTRSLRPDSLLMALFLTVAGVSTAALAQAAPAVAKAEYPLGAGDAWVSNFIT